MKLYHSCGSSLIQTSWATLSHRFPRKQWPDLQLNLAGTLSLVCRCRVHCLVALNQH